MRRSTCLVAKAFGRPSMVATLPIAFSVCSNFPTMLISHRGICDNNIPRVGNKRQTRAQKGWGQVAYDKTKHSISPFEKTIDEVCADIDTKLTPEQQTYVDMLKKKMSGGALSQKVRCKFFRSIYSPFSISLNLVVLFVGSSYQSELYEENCIFGELTVLFHEIRNDR